MPNTYDWLLAIPFWDALSSGLESRVFALPDFLVRSHRSDPDWYVHFRRWCDRRRGLALDAYDARSIGRIHGVEMLVVTRIRVRGSVH